MKKMTQKLMFLFLLLVVSLGYSQKVAVIGINHTVTDGFSFVATQDLSAGEVIYFTENEYNDATNTFVDTSEAVVLFTASSTILKGNVVFVNELATANTFSVTCTGGGSCGTAVLSGAGPFALGNGGESLYAYTDSNSNPLDGITTIYSVLYTGYFEGAFTTSGGVIVASQNPVFDFPNAIVIDGFPAVPPPDRVEFTPTALARTNVSKVVLENPSNYVHAQTSAALSTIFFTNLNLVASDPVVSVTASPSAVNENSGTGMVYTFSLSATATSNLTVNFSVGGSATFGSDYSQSGAASYNASTGTVTILNGSNTASITLTPAGDSTLEANETISLTLTSGSGYVAGSPGAATTTINNDDTLAITPIVAITGVNHSTTADGFSFVALQNIAAGTVVYFTENPFTNSALTFSGAEAVLQWTAPAGGLARGQVVVVTETATANTFTVTCSSGTCGSIGVVSGTFTLATTGEELYAYLDSDNNPTNGVTSVQAVLFTGTSVTPGGSIPSNQDPGTVYPGAVVVDGFPAVNPLRTEYNPTLRGVTVDRANFQNPANWLHAQSNITLSTVPFSNIIISTGVANPFASVSVAPSSVLENSGTPMIYTFSLTAPAAGNITVNFGVSGSATFSTDYIASGASSFTASTGSVVIPNGSSSATVQITPVGDTALEVQESVVLTITSGIGYDGGSPNAATGFINNDDTSDSDPLVAITGISHATTDGFSFVAAQDIPANTVVYFTDNSFNNNTLLFGSGEAVIRWTSPGTVITKGNVVVVTETGPDSFTVTCSNGTCGSVALLSGNLALATNGESLFAYEDNDTNPSNGVVDIYSVLFTGTPTVIGGNIPTIQDPSPIFLSALVVDGFPATAPARTEYDATKRGVLVTDANFEDVSNWVHAQSPPALSTVPFANLSLLDAVAPNAICQNISVTPNVGTGSVTITAADINNGSTDNVGIVSYALDITTFTCANIGTPVTVTLTVTDAAGNSDTCTATVTVLPNAVATFTQVDPICAGSSFTLPTTSNNGTTGTWAPAINNTTTTTYTFTPNVGQCASSTTMTVVVNPSVIPTFNSVAAICSGDALTALPTTSLNGITGTWSPALNNTATTLYTFTPDAGQCANTATLTITVNTTPPPVSSDIILAFTGQCGFLSGTYTYEGLLNGKASFVGLPSPNIKVSFDGVKWVLWDSNINIGNTGFQNTTVPAGLYPPLTGWTPTLCSTGTMNVSTSSSFELCDGATIANLAVTGTTLQWYDAATNGNSLPTSTVLVTGAYYVSQTLNGCESPRGLVNVVINPIVTPTFNSVAAICTGDTLSALPTTSNNGITGTWSPALNNTATTLYTFTPNVGQCASTASLTITVIPIVTPTFNSVAAICSGDALTALPTTSLNGIIGTWSPALNNTATTLYTFTPDASQCAVTASLTITVNPIVTPTFNPVAAICSGDALSALPTTSLNGITGAWSPALNNTATTLYTFTPDAGQCALTASLTITVNPVVTPTFNPVAAICAGDALTALPTTSNNGITGTWLPALNNAATTLYTFTPDAGQCAATASLTIVVNVTPVPSGANNQTFQIGATLANVVVSGTAIQWYDAANNGNPLPLSTVLVNGATYYATQTINGCESATFEVQTSVAAGAASLTGTYCGATLNNANVTLVANYVIGAQGYRFRVRNAATNAVVLIVDRPVNSFALSNYAAITLGTTYTIDVALRIGGVWQSFYGLPCSVTTPTPVTTIGAQCGTTLTSMGQWIFATVRPNVTGYRFRVTNTATSAVEVYTALNGLNKFNFNQLPAAFRSFGTVYSVEVALRNTDGTYLPYGTACNITTPNAAKTIVPSNEFVALTYPNPFAENFMFDVKTSSESTIQIRVYDMLGKLIENRNIEFVDIKAVQLGDVYPSGVYNVILSQDDNVQTLRVIKR